MKLKFDANLKYQLDAIQSVTDLFDGQPSAIGTQQVFGRLEGDLKMQINELGIGNPPDCTITMYSKTYAPSKTETSCHSHHPSWDTQM